jgi:hypothetical protein
MRSIKIISITHGPDLAIIFIKIVISLFIEIFYFKSTKLTPFILLICNFFTFIVIIKNNKLIYFVHILFYFVSFVC